MTAGFSADHINQPIDLAPFAVTRWWAGTEGRALQTHPLSAEADSTFKPIYEPETGLWQLGLEWLEPRDVCRVVVEYAGALPPDIRIQYWQSKWPTPAPERSPGARRGWIGRDDPWHGHWTTARGEVTQEGQIFTLTFDPLDFPELSGPYARERLNDMEHYRANFRRTLKLRVVSGGETQPVVRSIRAFAPTTWQAADVAVRFGYGASNPVDWSGQVTVINGYLTSLESLGFGSEDSLEGDDRWHCQVAGQPKGVRLKLAYTPGDQAASNGTVVTIQTKQHSFSFLVANLLTGPIYIKPYGVFITHADAEIDFNQFQQSLAAAPKPIYERVFDEPEQSLQRATTEITAPDVTKQEPFGQYVVLGLEAGRQEFGLRYNGELFADKSELKLRGRDAARLQWPGPQLRYRFGSGDPADFREGRNDATRQSRLEGWLPIFNHDWLDREIEYEQTTFVAQLDGPMTPAGERRGDENIVAMLRFRLRNVTHGTKRACLWIAIAPQEQLTLQGGLVIADGRLVPAEPVKRQWRVDPYPAACLRAAIDTHGHGELSAVPYSDQPGASQAVPTAILYQVELAGGESHTITMAMPFVSLTDPGEWAIVAALDYETKRVEVESYWRAFVEPGGQLHLPDSILNQFYKAARVHVALSVDKDPATGMIIVPAGAWRYGACGNEACWQITMLDQAGHHDRAATFLDTYLRTQGVIGLDGNFASKEGVVQAMDLDDGQPVRGGFSYNTDHGFIMECLANHYRYTGDRDWLSKIAPQLVAACDFVTRERTSTKTTNAHGQRCPEWGLLPAGHLEDNPEWRYWFAVNAHAYAGMRAIAAVLAEIDHPAAARLTGEAEAYRADIRAAAQRAMIEAPVVRLLDGSYIPRIPTRTDLRGREWGWFREVGYGALHLMEGNVFAPNEPEMTWLLQDLEDNLYVSREWGRPVDLEKYWFSHGGITIQPSLTDLGIDYLRRGEIKHALRALFNHFGASFYPGVNVFTEHPVVELGHGIGPFYKSPDETKFLTWLRNCLIREDGTTLHLAPGAPRAWLAPGQNFGVEELATFFGAISYQINSTEKAVTVTIDPPQRLTGQSISLRLRRPGDQRLQSVTVNGQAHTDFDPDAETIQLTAASDKLVVEAGYV